MNVTFDFTPFPNQRENILKLITRTRCLLSDKVGSGKTMSIVGAFGTLYLRDVLRWMVVLMPLNAYEKKVWHKDIERFTSLRAVDLDEITDIHQLDDYDIILAKHTHIKSDKAELIRLMISDEHTLLCVDEAHAFKNPKSQQTQILHDLIANNKNRWFITGTVLSKSLEDTYHILNLLHENCLGNFFQFRNRWCITEEKVIGRFKNGKLKKAVNIIGLKNPNEFLDFIEPIIVTGESFVNVKFHYIDYSMNSEETSLYRRVADGVEVNPEYTSEDWIASVLKSTSNTAPKPMIKSVERFSSRFIYLQSCADGTLDMDGSISRSDGTKMKIFADLISDIVSKNQSAIVYFDYIATLSLAEKVLQERLQSNVVLLKSTGENVLKDGSVTEEKCRKKPHIILGTRASSESVSYYFINNVIFFHCPTVPHTATQLVGRITRKNTLYPNDLNCYFFRSDNIDLYKLKLVSFKCAQMELVQGHEGNIPDDYKVLALEDVNYMEDAKKNLLWRSNT